MTVIMQMTFVRMHKLRHVLDHRIFEALTFVRLVVFLTQKFQIVHFVSDVLIKLGVIFFGTLNISH